MTPIASMVAQMIASGVSADMIALAVETAEIVSASVRMSSDIPQMSADERRRQKDRERKAAARAAEKACAEISASSVESPQMSAEIHGKSADVRGQSVVRTIFLSKEQEVLEEDKEEERKIVRTVDLSGVSTDILDKPKASRGKRLPENWRPTDTHYAEGQLRGHSRQTIDEFATNMRLWADANANRAIARKADWNLTFLGWIRRQPLGNSAPEVAKPSGFKSIVPDLPEPELIKWFAEQDRLKEEKKRNEANGKAH